MKERDEAEAIRPEGNTNSIELTFEDLSTSLVTAKQVEFLEKITGVKGRASFIVTGYLRKESISTQKESLVLERIRNVSESVILNGVSAKRVFSEIKTTDVEENENILHVDLRKVQPNE